MMTQEINTIFLDLGNTLRFVIKDADHMAKARQKIVDLIGTDENPLLFFEKLNDRYAGYRTWAIGNRTEAPEADLWTRWLAPDFPIQKIIPLSVELTYQFRQCNGRRVVVEGGKEVIIELNKRGYKLGIISNLISSTEIREWLDDDELSSYFSSVVLSSVFGKRKPDPDIYLEAARLAQVNPKNCAYVGDKLDRDVPGTRQAGFGLAIIFNSPEVLASSTITDKNRPDITIHEFRQLLDIFKERPVSQGYV